MVNPHPSIKIVLHQQCMAYINRCIDHASLAIEEAQQSANNETKSSAGDKHETGRAILQLEQEKNTKQLAEAIALKERLSRIDPTITSEIISVGSVIITSEGNFYIAVAAGKLEIEQDFYFAISSSSPIAGRLLGLKPGQDLTFNGAVYKIRYVL